MKKYFIGMIAIAFALSLSAFTTHKPTGDDLVYFEIIDGDFDDLSGGVLTSTPFSCAGDDEMCAKGYHPSRSTVVVQNGEIWTLIDTGAEEDDFKKRDN